MGKPSYTNPMRQPAGLCAESRVIAALVCLAVLLVAGLVGSSARAQAAQALVLPSAIAFDAQGNLYFAETGSHVVREFSVGGVLSVVAGTGVQGYSGDGGPAVAAELDSPSGLALDSAGNVYIADTHNQRVREVSAATGLIATIAGTGAAGYSGDGGVATAARLDLPTALAVNAAGDVFVADTDNHRVRRIAAGTGLITTVVGNGVEGFAGDGGPAVMAAVDSPSGLALDAGGNLYVADTHNGRVRKVSTATGNIATLAGAGFAGGAVQAFGGDGGAATAAGLALPRGLSVDAAGNIYVADSANHRIRRISPAGVIATVAGQGTEAFAGDGAPAVAASLDSPRSVALSPGGLLTLADTGNRRVRQLDSLPAPGPDIHTIAGVGSGAPETLSLSGPATVVYGSGTLTATLSGGTSATGSVTFMDVSGGTSVAVGTVSLSSGSAVFSTGTLAAGAHSIVAMYAGDANHAAAESAAMALTVTPLGVTATASPVSVLYGLPIPAISGALSGVLLQDAGKVSAVFSTSAAMLSPVGAYPIAAALSGSAAGNYVVTTAPASVSITQAPSVTTLSASTNSPSVGVPITLTMHATSTTSGVPTGSVTLLDGTAVVTVVPLVGGGASFTTSSMAVGAHSLSVAYSGDTNFLASTSPVASLTVGAASDFTLASTGATSQTVPAGNAATFGFSVATTGAALASPITLAVQGIPAGATASLSPSVLPPGGAVSSFTLTIQTPFARLERPAGPYSPTIPGSGLLAVLLLPAVGLARRSPFGRGRRAVLVVIAAGVLCVLAGGCGDRVNAVPESANAKTYTVTVTGTATGPAGGALQHSVTVTLQVL